MRSARAAFLLLWLTASLTVSSCGGGDSDEPGIPRATAEALADRSERVADLLARGQRCAAAHEADRLRDQAGRVVGAVPTRFQEELMSAANELVDEINCPPPPQPVAEEDQGENRGKGKGKGKKGDDD